MPATPVWLWPNLLSLDAPIVAVVWQDLAARSFGAPIRPSARVVLGLTVWAVYLADRLLDVRSGGPASSAPRHEFYRRHPRAMAALLAAVAAADAALALAELRPAVFVHGLAVAACVGVYLLVFPLRASGWEKQVFAAALFAAGVLLVASTWVSPWELALPGILFAALCLSNLVLIELWERGEERRLLWLAPAAVAAAALLRFGSEWHKAIAAAGVLLAGVAISESRLTLDAKRVLADVVLLTPLLFR